MNALVLSVLLSLVSAVAYAGGAIVQERVAANTPGTTYAPMHQLAWWIAVGLNALGGLLHVVALAYGPLSLVQPLGALTIVFALPMAALFVRRKAGATAWRGAIMATVGLAGLLALVGTADSQSLNSTQRVVVALVTGGAVVALMMAARAVHRHPAVRSVLLATAAGVAFGMSSVFTKTVAVDWTGGVSLADVPSLAVIGVLATAGMLLSQASYRGAGLAAPLATLTVINPIVAAAVGITMFGETFRYGETGTALALGCGVVAAGGLILLTTERISGSERTAPVSVPASVPVPATAGAMADAAVRTEPGPAVEASRAEEPAVPPGRALPEQLVPAERLVVSTGVRDAEARDQERAREDALAHAAGLFASAASRQDALLPPPGDTPDDIEGIDEPSWPNGGYYGLPFLPLLPAPVVIRSSVKS
ncbi:drug/metabolite transporter (DMT)-like permease [Streptomyces phaeochromogenes]|uniref:DMT family transporter n=1 Tax=Streptomyces phaeochromogenes TaxID=1923 RepID=UPI0027932B08|nr:DMT family transporter [Streptomyces phaeochromogenes]MDQ0947886.1 drug/metabolite transporter (DMT)-like permease [Streptomyces phaeochromogenes]